MTTPNLAKRLVVQYEDGQLIDWSPNVVARMALIGVEISGRRLPRPVVWRRLWAAFRAWFAWTTALPGDTFLHFQRDLLIEVDSGLPRRRRARVMARMAMRYPVVQRHGMAAMFDLIPAEPCDYRWHEVFQVKGAAIRV
jgi:hypothetical protein